MTEAKVITTLAVLIVVMGLLGFGGTRLYEHGLKNGEARIQVQFDQFKADVQRTADTAIAAATKERDDANARNEVTRDGYQTQLLAANANAADFAERLRRAEASLAAGGSAVPKAGGGSAAATAGAPSSADQLGKLAQLTADLHAECIANASQLDALIAEIKPQL